MDDLTGKESGWTALCFDTPAEQIFTKVVPGITSATLQWDIEKEATNIKYGQLIQMMNLSLIRILFGLKIIN